MSARFFARRTRKAKKASTPARSKEPILKQTFKGHEDRIWDFVFLHDNVHIVSSSEDSTMRKWNCDTGLPVGEPWESWGGKIYALALSPDGKMIACGREYGNVQRWNTDGEMIRGIWTGHSSRVVSLSWSPRRNHLASGSEDATILIRNAENGRVVVGPIKTEQIHVYALVYSPSGDRIASGGDNKTICIWDTETGKLVVGPIKNLGNWVTSLVWSSDSTKLYSASDRFARVFDSKSGTLIHSFEHDHVLNSVALSPKHNVLACVGDGIAQLWDTESIKPLGQPFSQAHREWLNHVSFSQDGHHLAYGGDDEKLTLLSAKDIAPQLAAPMLPQQSDRQSIQQETRPNSPSSSSSSSSCLDADATGGDGIIEEGDDDPYNNFFQTSHQSLPSATLGSQPPNLFSTRRFLNVFSRLHPPADQSVPKERFKRKFFVRHARSHSSLELATIDSLGARKDKDEKQDDPPADAQSPPFHHATPPAGLDTHRNRNLWGWPMQTRGKNTTSSFLDFSVRPINAPHPIPRRPWHWNSNSFPVGSSRRPVDVFACRDEDRYGIVPESDAEAAAAMLRTTDNEVDSPTRPGQPAVGAQVQPTQTQVLATGPEENVYEGVSCCGFFFGYRRRSNLP